MFKKSEEHTPDEIHEQRNPSNNEVNTREKAVSNRGLTGASALTVKQSVLPITLVTILFFLWGFAYGLLDVLNAKFQTALNITAAKAGGSGLSTLETSANPFIATCGPPRLSEFRLELSQSFQAVGSVVAPLLASRVFFSNTEPSDISKVQWTYLGFAVFVFVLAVVFFFSPIPEVTDADMELQAEQSSGLTGYEDKPIRKQYKLFFGVAAQFCYVGAQVGVASNFINYCVESAGLTAAQGSDRYAIGQGVFAIGRFAAAGLMMYVKPRIVLGVFMTGVMIFICLAIGFHGEAGVAFLCLVLFFESCVFPLIFTLSIRGLGRHTKRGSSYIIASICGGALFPSLTGLLADHKGYHIGMCVPLTGFFVSFVYPIFLNTVYKRELDGFRESKIGYQDEHGTIGDLAREAQARSLGATDSVDGKGAPSSKHLEVWFQCLYGWLSLLDRGPI
ncbi:hypothetical protein N0V82_005208 [Gnomoniopsis sp. IMI 355080]|nr:hypothetical protein N0V82_005208 [Gnomoniopsis sp. IMI 355080]